MEADIDGLTEKTRSNKNRNTNTVEIFKPELLSIHKHSLKKNARTYSLITITNTVYHNNKNLHNRCL